VVVPIREMAAKLLMTMMEYPPSETAGSFGPSRIGEQLRSGAGSR
jgi:hypothetical protein